MRDFRIFTMTKWRAVELVYFPLTTVIMWALFAVYSRSFSGETGLMLLGINIFWSFAYLTQSTANLQMSEDTWSGSMKQILVSGISEMEYILARIISSVLISSLIMAMMLVSTYLFGFTFFLANIGPVLALGLMTLIASIAMAMVVAGLIVYLGPEYNFLAWTTLQVFILLSAPFYSVDVFPEPFRSLSLGMPFTNVFSSVRSLINTGAVSTELYVAGFAVGLLYLAASVPLYRHLYCRAKLSGKLAKMD
jgi:ABC-2 type transport system permease protein